jgi:hypothetical protein
MTPEWGVPEQSEPPAGEATPVIGVVPPPVVNRQGVGQGAAVGRDVLGDVVINMLSRDGDADGQILKPRLREGPYPAEDVEDRLRGFVTPPSHRACLDTLTTRRVLLLRGEAGTGTSTAALALLREVAGGRGITGLSFTDLAKWKPSAGGYLSQGLDPETVGRLDEVALHELVGRLGAAGAYLVVIVDRSTVLPRALSPWCGVHTPPDPADVARTRLRGFAEQRALSGEELEVALALLDRTEFKDYLAASRSPLAGTEVADELREVAVGDRSVEEAAENLRLGTREAAVRLLTDVRKNPADLALTAALALLERQDRSEVERFTAPLRARITERVPAGASAPEGDLLGRHIDERLAAVRAQLLPRVPQSGSTYRYWAEPVAFRGRHLADEVLRRLWLDYEGFSDVLLTWLAGLPYVPGLDRIAGQRIGRVLCQASGPYALQGLTLFAKSTLAWQRRLAGFALVEAAQDAVLSPQVRSQLRGWGKGTNQQLRCTAAETCAAGLGLALPDFTLGLLSGILDQDERPGSTDVRTAVSAAIGVLLTEDANREPVLRCLAAWLTEPSGAPRREYAIRGVRDLCGDGFPAVKRTGVRRLTFHELYAAGAWETLLPLVGAALDDPTVRKTVMTALLAVEEAPDAGGDERLEEFFRALAEAGGGQRGLVRVLIERWREERRRARAAGTTRSMAYGAEGAAYGAGADRAAPDAPTPYHQDSPAPDGPAAGPAQGTGTGPAGLAPGTGFGDPGDPR